MEQNDRPKALDWTRALDKARGRKPVAKPPAPLPEPSRRPAKIPPAASNPNTACAVRWVRFPFQQAEGH